ncbi:MAG: hypothetical protein OCD76_21455 [Reichenbachiella sp.]
MDINIGEEFLLKAENGFVRIALSNIYGYPNETCHWGGYDTKSTIEIVCSNYKVLGELYISTGEIYNFYQNLQKCHKSLSGEAYLRSYESNLEMKLVFDNLGHVEISGTFQEVHMERTELKFELETDQSYLTQTLTELSNIHDKYGDNKGVKDK